MLGIGQCWQQGPVLFLLKQHSHRLQWQLIQAYIEACCYQKLRQQQWMLCLDVVCFQDKQK